MGHYTMVSHNGDRASEYSQDGESSSFNKRFLPATFNKKQCDKCHTDLCLLCVGYVHALLVVGEVATKSLAKI